LVEISENVPGFRTGLCKSQTQVSSDIEYYTSHTLVVMVSTGFQCYNCSP